MRKSVGEPKTNLENNLIGNQFKKLGSVNSL